MLLMALETTTWKLVELRALALKISLFLIYTSLTVAITPGFPPSLAMVGSNLLNNFGLNALRKGFRYLLSINFHYWQIKTIICLYLMLSPSQFKWRTFLS